MDEASDGVEDEHGDDTAVEIGAAEITAVPALGRLQEPAMPGDLDTQQRLFLDTLQDDKAEDIIVIDLDGKSSIADRMIIASGRSSRHVGAIADHLVEAAKAAGVAVFDVEGKANADWVLVDAGDVIVHLFRPEVRAFYNIEKMWGVEPPVRAEPVAASADFLRI